MKKCNIHNHTSEAHSIVCYEKRTQKRVDRHMKRIAEGPINRYIQVKCEPPMKRMLGNVDVFYFWTALTIGKGPGIVAPKE